MPTISAFCVTGHIGVLGDHPLSRLKQRAYCVALAAAPAVVHAVKIAVLENRDVGGGHSFPGPIQDEDLTCRTRRVEFQLQIVHGIDQPVVHEKFQA